MTSTEPASVVGLSRGDRALLFVGGPVLGTGIGWALPPVARWADGLPWVPFDGPVRLVASWDAPWVAAVLLVLGVLAGLGLAAYSVWETLRITVTVDRVTLRAMGSADTVTRDRVAGVFVDGKQLVLLGTGGGELARRRHDSKPAELADAFRRHDYPWLDADPHAEEFLRWVPDSPDVSPAADALLKARATALEKKQRDEVDDLRRALAKLGYVVRDEKTRQYWRAVPNQPS